MYFDLMKKAILRVLKLLILLLKITRTNIVKLQLNNSVSNRGVFENDII